VIVGHLAPFGCFGGVVLLAIAGTVFWIWALIDCATKEPNEGNQKVVWILVIVFTHFLGAVLYVLIRRPDRVRQFGR
jgi:multisubunit Na+/H+ antiporter MnhB subunit